MAHATLSDVELLARLVGFDSTSRNSNLPIAGFICDYLDRPGIRIEQLPSPAGDKVNLAVFVGPEVDARSRAGLVLSGHMDVVPADEPEWTSDPFTLTDGGDRWIGRGAADMKGFDAIAVNAAVETAARAAAGELAAPLVLILTYDEEVGTIGARDFAAAWPAARPLPRRAIIGEPTSLEVVRLHKGHAKLRVSFRGREAHSGYPHLGTSAIEPAARAIVALEGLRRRLEREPVAGAEHFPAVPFVALNVGTVSGGSAVNVVPAHCRFEVGLRILPGMTAEPVVERTESVIRAAAGSAVDIEIALLNDSPPLATAEDNDLYQHLIAERGQTATVSASYATDGGWLQRCGLDCLIFGPGTIEVAHKPNESMPKAEYADGGRIVRQLVDRCCGRA